MNQWPRGHFSGKARTEVEIFNELDGHFYTMVEEKNTVKDSWREPFVDDVAPRGRKPIVTKRKPGWFHPDMLPRLKEMLNNNWKREAIAEVLGISAQSVYHQERRLILIAEGKLKPRGPA